MFVKQVMQYLCSHLKQNNNVETIIKLMAYCPSSIQFFKVGLYHSMSLEEMTSYVSQIVKIDCLSLYILEQVMLYAVELDHMWQENERDDVSSVSDGSQSNASNNETVIQQKLDFLVEILLSKMKADPSEKWVELYKKCLLPSQSHALNAIYVWYISTTGYLSNFLGLLGNEWLYGENILTRTRSVWCMTGFLIRVEMDSDFIHHAYKLMLDYLEHNIRDLVWFSTIQSAMYMFCFHSSKLFVADTMRLINLIQNGALALASPMIVEQFCRITEEKQLWFSRVSLKRQRRSVKEEEKSSVEMLWHWFPLDPVDLPVFKSVSIYYKSFQQ